MTEFGQSLPATPQVYNDQTLYSFTKAGFISHLTRALETVGMVPIRQSWPWDPTSEPERVVPDDNGVAHIFSFDYPDTSTFSVNNTLYRPCLQVGAWFGNFTNSSGSTNTNNYLLIQDAVRPDGQFNLDEVFTMRRRRTPATTNFGWSNGTDVITSWTDVDGADLFLQDWKPYDSFVGNDQNLLNVQNFYVYLGPAGLFIFVGTGSARTQFGSHLACGFVFGGGRIPNRELVPDTNLNRINPVIPLFLRASGAANDQYDTDTGIYNSLIHGIQFDLKSTLTPVRCQLFNLENVEIPIYPDYGPFTVPSPRPVGGGSGAHILGRLIQVPTSREDNASDLYGPTESQLSANEVRPSFGDVYTAPGFRFVDRSAPLGLSEDPITLTDWYLVPTYNTDQQIALDVENVSEVSALASLTPTALNGAGDHYTFSGTPTSGDGFDFPNLAGGLVAPTVVQTDSSAAAVAWDDTQNTGPMPDQVVATVNAAGASSATTTADFVIPISASDTEDTFYTLSFRAENQNDASTESRNPLEVDVFQYGTWVNLLSLDSAGTNGALPGATLTTYTFGVLLDTTITVSKQIRIRFVANKDGVSFTGNTVTIRELRIIKSRYL